MSICLQESASIQPFCPVVTSPIRFALADFCELGTTARHCALVLLFISFLFSTSFFSSSGGHHRYLRFSKQMRNSVRFGSEFGSVPRTSLPKFEEWTTFSNPPTFGNSRPLPERWPLRRQTHPGPRLSSETQQKYRTPNRSFVAMESYGDATPFSSYVRTSREPRLA